MKPRILLVEDVTSTRRAYKRVLEMKDLEVHEAANFQEAAAAIARIAYHVICVDLQLKEGDPSNFEGTKVLKELALYDEGTRAIVVSDRDGSRAHDIAIEAYETYGLAKWLRKGQFSVDEYVAAIEKEARSVNLPIFKRFRSPLEALLDELDADFWIDEALRALNPRGGFVSFDTLLSDLIRGLAPIRPHKDREQSATIDAGAQRITFRFWSRSIGQALVCTLTAKEEDGAEDVDIITRVSKFGIKGLVRRTPNGLPDSYR